MIIWCSFIGRSELAAQQRQNLFHNGNIFKICSDAFESNFRFFYIDIRITSYVFLVIVQSVNKLFIFFFVSIYARVGNLFNETWEEKQEEGMVHRVLFGQQGGPQLPKNRDRSGFSPGIVY